MVRVLALGLIFAVLAACDSESYTEIEKTRAPLFPGFVSYASLNEVKAKLPPQAVVKVVEETSLTKDASKPPYRTYAISVTPYDHLQRPGKLVLIFYNDRLQQTSFYPAKLDDYVEALQRSGVSLGFGQEIVQGHTVIWIGTDFDNKSYVGWADTRLREQQRRWLANYQ